MSSPSLHHDQKEMQAMMQTTMSNGNRRLRAVVRRVNVSIVTGGHLVWHEDDGTILANSLFLFLPLPLPPCPHLPWDGTTMHPLSQQHNNNQQQQHDYATN
jgi:hypothetical protein